MKRNRSVSEHEFDRQTELIDAEKFWRKTKLAKIACAVVGAAAIVLCIAVAVNICNGLLAKKTYDDLLKAIDEVSHQNSDHEYIDVIKNITQVLLDERDNVVVVRMIKSDQSRIDGFKAAFPKAKRVRFTEGVWVLKNGHNEPSSAEDKTENVYTETTDQHRSGLEYTIENLSAEYVYVFGEEYYLEIYVDEVIGGPWFKVPVYLLPDGQGIEWGDDIYVLTPGEKRNIEVNWESTYGDLAKGRYCLIKTIYVFDRQDYDPNATSYDEYDDVYVIAIEFTIE